MTFTGINKLLKSETLQKILNQIADGTFSEFVNDWKWILSYSKQYQWFVLLYGFLGLFGSTLNVISSYVLALAINIITGHQTDKLVFLLGLLICTQLSGIGFNALRGFLQSKISISVRNDIQAEVFESMVDVRWDALNRYRHGDLLNRLNEDVKTVSDDVIAWIPDLITNLYTFIVTLFVLYRMDPIIAGIGLCSAPILFLISRSILKQQQELRRKVLELDSALMSFETEAFYNMDTVKAFGIWDVFTERLRGRQEHYKKRLLDYNVFQIKTNSSLSLFNILVMMGAFCYCLFRLWSGKILYGNMVFFLEQLSALAKRLESLVNTVPTMLNAAVSARRIREIIDLPKEIHDAAAFETFLAKADQGLSIEMNHVTFAYGEGTNIFEDVTFSAKPGEVIALIGESGSGKTTLFRLLLGLIRPISGEVVLRGGNETAVMNADLRRLISYVPQGNTIFQGNIADNLRMVRKTASDAEIIDALKIACAWEFVEPIGIDSEIGERGKGISEGQAQRLSIARAVLRGAPIMFYDEATSALDTETESRVIENLIRTLPNRTIIISTHRPALLKKCARVYQIKDKRISVYDN